MSPDRDQEYFADGISEELLNLLTQVPELRVIARTSSFSFKGKDVDIAQIARTLNVANVLEGSVRKSSDKVRITAQLVRASDSSHLWSQTYDRQLTDVFKVQDEIAAAVVEQLKITLLGEAPRAKEVNADAYALFLQGRQLRRQGTPEGYEQAIALFQQALAIDPNYAAVWEQLASVYAIQAGWGMRPIAEGLRLAREAATKALAIDPEFAPAHGGLGWIALTFDADLAAAARHYEHALALEPANPDIIGGAASLAASLNRLDTAIALYEYATTRDPLNTVVRVNLGHTFTAAARLDDAIASLRRVLRLAPESTAAHYLLALALLMKGDAQSALTETQKESDESWRLFGLTMVNHTLGRKADSDAAFAETIRDYASDSAYNIAYILAWRNERDRAFEWLDKAVTQEDPGLSEIAYEPLFANLHDDRRWLPFLRKIGKAPEQLAAIKFDVEVPK